MSTLNVPPAPLAPWQRPAMSPLTQTLQGAGEIDLNCDTTYLDAAAGTMGEPFAATLGDGNYRRQIKRIYVKGGRVTDGTAAWNVSGRFVGFSSLTFSGEGHSAVLEWDGEGWHMIGGNAVTNA